jgi:hypothetical protein
VLKTIHVDIVVAVCAKKEENFKGVSSKNFKQRAEMLEKLVKIVSSIFEREIKILKNLKLGWRLIEFQ